MAPSLEGKKWKSPLYENETTQDFWWGNILCLTWQQFSSRFHSCWIRRFSFPCCSLLINSKWFLMEPHQHRIGYYSNVTHTIFRQSAGDVTCHKYSWFTHRKHIYCQDNLAYASGTSGMQVAIFFGIVTSSFHCEWKIEWQLEMQFLAFYVLWFSYIWNWSISQAASQWYEPLGDLYFSSTQWAFIFRSSFKAEGQGRITNELWWLPFLCFSTHNIFLLNDVYGSLSHHILVALNFGGNLCLYRLA